jgi:hypothetical protein
MSKQTITFPAQYRDFQLDRAAIDPATPFEAASSERIFSIFARCSLVGVTTWKEL